jgi:hypothetical protein
VHTEHKVPLGSVHYCGAKAEKGVFVISCPMDSVAGGAWRHEGMCERVRIEHFLFEDTMFCVSV